MTIDVYKFRNGEFNFSEDTNVADSFEVKGLKHLSLKQLSFLWEAGFSITGLDKEGVLYYFDGNFYGHLLDESNLNLWNSILLQLQDEPMLVSAFTVESTTVNPYLINTLFRRDICCISAEVKLPDDTPENIIKKQNELNRLNTEELESTLKEKYFPIKLQGMFYDRRNGKESAKPQEISFLVVQRKGQSEKEFINDMFELGKRYNQNSVLIREVNKRNAYYLGTSEVEQPDTFAPGLGNKGQFGELLPYKLADFCSIPFNQKTIKGKTVRKLDYKDSFAYDEYKQKLPRLNSKNWKKVDTNLYEYIGDDFPKYYKWTVVNDGIVYSGIERSLAQADNLIKRAKKGLLKSKR